jgi:hypothetical protein
MFIREQGSLFMRRQLWAYVAAIVARFVLGSHLGAAGIVWCTVPAQGISFALNLRSCLKESDASEAVASLPAPGEAY